MEIMNAISFEAEASSFPGEKKCVQRGSNSLMNSAEGDCLFGVPPSRSCGREVLLDLPKDAGGFHFYTGSHCSRIVKAFAQSEFAGQVRRISIGNTSSHVFSGVDYKESIAALGSGNYPALKIAELGVWRLLSNSHCMMGRLGCLDDFLSASPNIEVLRLFGNFDMKKRAVLPRLKKLYLQQEDPVTGGAGEAIASSSVENMLDSSFPSLEDAFIDLERDGGQAVYGFPDRFVEGVSFGSLRKLTVYGNFLEGEYSRLRSGKVGDRIVGRLYQSEGL